MKIYNLYHNIKFGLSSFVQQNLKPEDIQKENTEEISLEEINKLEKQPIQDEFIKETLENQERYRKELEEKNKKFNEAINRPQKFHK